MQTIFRHLPSVFYASRKRETERHGMPTRLPRVALSLFGLAVIHVLCCLPPACAAEQVVLRFVESPRTSEHVVRLGDLVEVLAGNSPSLEQIMRLPLGPSPRENSMQTWHSRDVLQHLELRGLQPTSMRWSGATQVELQRVSAGPDTADTTFEPAFVQARTVELAEKLVAQAIVEFLELQTGERTDWRIVANVPTKLADVIRIRRNIVGIGGGQAPWLGEQEFVLQIKDHGRIVNVPIAAHIDLPPMVVVATRPLGREQIIQADMLELAPLPQRAGEDPANFYTDMEQLIGKQLKRSISTGLPISSAYVGAPTVIGRNEMVEVESVSGGVTVRTMARSLGSGAVGDLIDIETVPSKHRMLATIMGPLKVRVAAVSARGGLER
ncbi:MAG: flagellar basal body P-ring formation protein FlgA [Pirellulaceae bacterium]|nr:flagellar basal body P-ring formation protein FlgA [Pirellulaceae bacterium]